MEDNRYTKMQREFYNSEAEKWSLEDKNPVVGSFDLHNEWEEYEFLFESFETKDKLALDFACGPGRNIARYWDRFKAIEGVDISEVLLKKATEYLQTFNITTKLYPCNGYDLNLIGSHRYDMVFSTIALQHICVWTIRYNYFKEFFRILVSGGRFAAQMGFGEGSKNVVPYYFNFYDAPGTNRAMDTEVIDPQELEFDLLRIGFTNFEYKIGECGPGDMHPAWIYFRVTKP